MERVKAVIFDWAGTVIDYGSLAPMGAFVETFAEFGVTISIDEARGPMGMAKRPHIAAIMALPRVAQAWTKRTGMRRRRRTSTPSTPRSCRRTSRSRRVMRTLIPGAAEVVDRAQKQGDQDRLVDRLHARDHGRDPAGRGAQGFEPDSLVCTGDTPDGRPTPFMLYKTLLDLEVWPAWSVIKVDDTEVGIAEGINGGRVDGRRVGQRQLFRPVA